MSFFIAQAFTMFVLNVAGIGVLIWILILVRQQNKKFDLIRKDLQLLEKAREAKEKTR